MLLAMKFYASLNIVNPPWIHKVISDKMGVKMALSKDVTMLAQLVSVCYEPSLWLGMPSSDSALSQHAKPSGSILCIHW